MKKALSLALALAMCLGLTVPALAADAKAGDTTITDTNGVTYQLSNPISEVREQVTVSYTYYMGDEAEEGSAVLEKAYIVPAGTKVTILSVEGYQMIENEYGDIIFEHPNDPDETIRCMLSIHMGMGGLDKAGFTVGDAYYGVSSYREHPRKGILHETEVYYFVAGTAESSTTPDPAEPVTPAEPVVKTAVPTNDKLYVDGELVVPTAYKIGGSNYFKIRDVAALLNGTDAQFSVDYDNAAQAVTLTTGESYAKKASDLAGVPEGDKEAISSNDAIYINGEKAELTVYKIGGSNYFKLRDLGKALGFHVGYTEGYGAFIESDKPYGTTD